ncbi:lipoma-preferred partner homolog [Cydia splendana]|uniref:lipoma-preferred partner homolog n=1 Tax=Cydia splendana TaxID=1100963 RepID=UPI0028F48BC2
MSRLDNIDALEKQLADLQMTNKEFSSISKGKKIPPVVPPKKKAQPQVPRSAVVSTLREPSYSTKISPVLNNNAATQTQSLSNVHLTAADYANVSHSNVPGVSFSHNTPQTYNTTYSNLPPYRNNNDSLPPPPPPPPLHSHEEYLPPPSPVSSNYSELVRATANLNYNQERQNYPPIYQNEFGDYSASQGSNEYAIYEPINPRPHSSLSGQNTFHNYRNNVPTPGKSPLPKEEEVDALTNMLVQSISDSQDLDVFGICVKCDGKVVGESSGCTAMGNMYHVQCFSCYRCNTNLQGKPFYAVEGHPFCETDYYETLEKCSVCTKPILDRILRATGKPYHPTCFTCVVCGKSLDGIPFTVDAMNQIHCIEDFHKKFAPRCCVCELPIMPEEGQEETVRVVALDRSFHVRCYRCEDCGLLLSSEAEGRGCYPLDDHILCKNCNAHRIRMLTVPVMTTDL